MGWARPARAANERSGACLPKQAGVGTRSPALSGGSAMTALSPVAAAGASR